MEKLVILYKEYCSIYYQDKLMYFIINDTTTLIKNTSKKKGNTKNNKNINEESKKKQEDESESDITEEDEDIEREDLLPSEPKKRFTELVKREVEFIDIFNDIPDILTNKLLKEIKKGYIYIASSFGDMKKNYYKVGCTKNLEKRLSTLNTAHRLKHKVFYQFIQECNFINYNKFDKILLKELEFCREYNERE